MLWALILLGIAARLALAWVSWGTNDTATWQNFGRQVREFGLIDTYRLNKAFNHPPMPGYWAAAAHWLNEQTGVSFPFVFKLPVIASDAVCCLLLWAWWRARAPSGRPWLPLLAAAAYAWSLPAMLVSGHHCNTDPVYAMLCLLAVWLLDVRRRPLLAALALGAAINIKLIPGVLVLPMLLLARDRREFLSAIAGLAVMALPFVPIFIHAGYAFERNALKYTSLKMPWGGNYFLLEAIRSPRTSALASRVLNEYHDQGRWVMLLAMLLACLRARRGLRAGTIDRPAVFALVSAMFLVLAPGFALQYAVFPVPLLLAVQPVVGAWYGLFAGLFLFLDYLGNWQGGFPIDTTAMVSQPGAGPLFGLVGWGILAFFAWRTFQRSGRAVADHDA